jgi:hypothetical protein
MTGSPALAPGFFMPEDGLDFLAPAEMFTGRQSAAGRAQAYRRFGSLAEAVCFAVESQPAALICTTIETASARLHHKQITDAYNSPGYQAAAPKKKRGKA